MPLICVIDADSIPYICSNSALSKGLPIEAAYKKVDSTIDRILNRNNSDQYIMLVGGSNNYRSIVNPEYKKFRAKYRDKSEAGYYPEVKKYMIDKYYAYRCHGAEADDVCATLHSKMPNDTIIVSPDKDLLQIPGGHYDYLKDIYTTVTQLGYIKKTTNNKITATGDFLLYYQLLVGDSSDGISGIWKIGPQSAYKKLSHCTSSDQLKEVVTNIYKDTYKNDWEYYYNYNFSLLKINSNLILQVPTIIKYHYL